MNKEKKTFSIIMPVYNVSEFIEEAINSVIIQTFTNWELIIINDGSTDDSKEVIQKNFLPDSRIKIVDSKNGGLSRTRNKGLSVCSGDYVFFMDSDDIIHKDLLLNVHEKICLGAEVVMLGYEEFNETMGKAGKMIDSGVYSGNEIMHNILVRKLENYVWQFIIKRELLTEKLLFKDNLLFEDIDWTSRFLSGTNNVFYIKKALYLYRVRYGSITHTRQIKKARDLAIALELLGETIKTKFPKEIKNYEVWCKPLYLTIYWDYSLLGWESRKYKKELYRRISSYNRIGLDSKDKVKIKLIKLRIIDLIGIIIRKRNAHI